MVVVPARKEEKMVRCIGCGQVTDRPVFIRAENWNMTGPTLNLCDPCYRDDTMYWLTVLLGHEKMWHPKINGHNLTQGR